MNETTQEIKDFIKKTESFQPKPYLCPAFRWTIGYGHLIKDNEKFTSLTKTEAQLLFESDLQVFEDWLNNNKRAQLTNNQFSAIVSLAYNIGIGHLKESKLMAYINAGLFKSASEQFLRFNKAKINNVYTELKGLTTRRTFEKSVFDRID